ncbi:tyrosine recombinase XerC, partial [Chloroflexota bacterium]
MPRNEQMHPQDVACKANLRYWVIDFLITKRRKWQPTTLKIYTTVMTLYVACVGEDHWPPTRQGVLYWLEELERRVKPTTVHTYWIHLRTFLNYLEKVDVISHNENPVHQINKLELAPDKPDLPPVAFPAEDLNELFDCLTKQAKTGDAMAIRDLALLRFAYVTGCREGEIAQLTLDNLWVHQCEAQVLAETSKDKKSRRVYFDDEVRQALQDWFAVRPGASDVREVFVSLGGRMGRGQSMKPRALYDILQKWCKTAKIGCRKFHALRHTSAIDALDEGISLEKVRRQLGHANIKTTMGYLQGRDEDRARAYRSQSLSAG